MVLRAVDLFCGVGGFAHGMQKAGIAIVRSMDYEPAVIAVHKANIKKSTARMFRQIATPNWSEPQAGPNGEFRRGMVHKSRRSAHVFDLSSVLDVGPEIALDKPDIIFGGPPCQAFSTAGRKKGDEDERSVLTEAFAMIVATARPRYFIMENVKGLRGSETYARALAIFKRAGYGVSENVVDASYFGTPQKRQRFIVAGCLDETDGWFNAYLDQYKTAFPRTVAEVLGADFGTRLADFSIDGVCPDSVPLKERQRYSGYKLRERDRQRIAGVDSDARFYYSVPGGAQSACIRPTDRPADTIISSTLKGLPRTYRPVEGDPVDLRRLCEPTFEQYAQIAGYPAEWNWGRIRAEDKSSEDVDDGLVFGVGQRNLMLANSVPPPLAYAIGRALVDHHARRMPAAPVEAAALRRAGWQAGPKEISRYTKWLQLGKRLSETAAQQQLSDLRSAKRLVGSRELASAKEELRALDILFATSHREIAASRRAQLRRALINLADFQLYQEVVRIEGAFPDDDEAYARGEFHDFLNPAEGARSMEADEEREAEMRQNKAEELKAFLESLDPEERAKHIPPSGSLARLNYPAGFFDAAE